MTTHTDETRLREALHDRLRDERPDPERIIRVATATHARRLRRSRVGGTLVAAACVGAVAVGVPLVADRAGQVPDATEHADALPSATAPLTRAEQEQAIVDLIEEVAPGTPYVISPRRPRFILNHPAVTIISDALSRDQRRAISAGLPEGWGADYMKPNTREPLAHEIPVTVPEGWTCEWYLLDDKASCQAVDGGVASLVIRPAADHGGWLDDSDKGANPSTYVTEVHRGIFISVQTGLGTTDAEIQDLGAGLEWID